MSIHTQPAAIDSVKKSLVALKMPRALEMLDATLRRVEQGEVTWIEALDQLLIEEGEAGDQAMLWRADVA